MLRLDEIRRRLPAPVTEILGGTAAKADADGRLDETVLRALAQERLLAPAIPKVHGGLGLSNLDTGLAAAAINTLCTSARSLLTVQSMVANAIERFGSVAQREKYLPMLASGERIAGFCLTGTGAGSDALDLSGASVERGETWRLSGKRVWVTFGQRADLLLVIAGPADQPVAALVDLAERPDEVRRIPRHGHLGLRGCAVADIEFTGRAVHPTEVLADTRFRVSHLVQTALDSGRFTVACGAAGLAIGCLDAATAHARSHTALGRPLGAYQLIGGHIADLMVHAETAVASCLRAAQARDERRTDAVHFTMIAKLVSTGHASAASALAVQCLGSTGVAPGAFAERAYRDARVLEIIEGTTEVLRLALASTQLRLVGVAT